jgi:hypothetical protein
MGRHYEEMERNELYDLIESLEDEIESLENELMNTQDERDNMVQSSFDEKEFCNQLNELYLLKVSGTPELFEQELSDFFFQYLNKRP